MLIIPFCPSRETTYHLVIQNVRNGAIHNRIGERNGILQISELIRIDNQQTVIGEILV